MYTPSRLDKIFNRAQGRCHLCGGALKREHYGKPGRGHPTAWEVDHSTAQALGGTDHGNNLFAAHASCNRSKGKRSNRTVRSANGIRRSPYTANEEQRLRGQRGLVGAALLGAVGAYAARGFGVAGPVGAVIGGLLGLMLGSSLDVETPRVELSSS